MIRIKKYITSFVQFSIAMVLSSQVLAISSLEALTKAERQQVVYISGSELGAVIENKVISQFSLMTVENGKLVPVPYQIDEYDVHGLVYFPNSGNDIDGALAIFDANDKLLFMLRDTSSERLDGINLLEGKVLKELEINSSSGPRYAYLVKGNAQRAEKIYVEHNIETGETKTDFYVLHTDPENELNWWYLNSRKNYDNGEPTTIDTFKVSFSGGFITKYPKVTLTNKNLRPTITGHKTGPIRTVTQLKATLVIAKIPLISQQMQAHRFGWHFEAHSHNKIPALFRKTISSPSMQVTLDGHEQYGGVTRIANWQSTEGIVVDGKMSRQEKQMLKAGITMEENWILFENPGSLMLMTMFDAPDSMLGLPLSMIYDDDKKSKLLLPERFRGHLPSVGYAIKGMPDVSDMIFFMRMLFLNTLDGMSPKEFADELIKKPLVRVSDPVGA